MLLVVHFRSRCLKSHPGYPNDRDRADSYGILNKGGCGKEVEIPIIFLWFPRLPMKIPKTRHEKGQAGFPVDPPPGFSSRLTSTRTETIPTLQQVSDEDDFGEAW